MTIGPGEERDHLGFQANRAARGESLANLLLFCQHCNGVYATTLNKAVTKFTLFFIPLFPIYIKHALTCTWCGATTEVSRADADQLVQQSQGPAQQPPMQQAPMQQMPQAPMGQQPPMQYPGGQPR